MGTLLVLLGMVGFIFGLGSLVLDFIKKRGKKKSLYILLGTFILFFAGSMLLPTSEDASNNKNTNLPDTAGTSEVKKATATSETTTRTTAAKEKKVSKKELVSQLKENQETNVDINNELAEKEFDGTQTIEVNQGVPTFTATDLTKKFGAWEYYGELDHLNRATYGEALLKKSLMPTEKRESLSVNPTGWHNKKIDKNYLYNRSHLIGFQLTGQNNNIRNLITGTRQLNSPEMLRFESDIAYFLKQHPKKYVRYSVVPVFRGEELVARGVHLQAQSIGSEEIRFNVYIFNIEDGVTINYSDGTSQTDAEIKAAQEKAEAEKKAAEEAAAAQAAEEQRKAEEAAAQQQAAELAAAQAAEAQRIAEAATAQSIAASEAAAQAAVPTSRTVYVAPQSGKKYHFSANCRGLSNANSIVSMTEQEAIAQGYTLCGWED